MTSSKKNVVRVLEAQMDTAWELYSGFKRNGEENTEPAKIRMEQIITLQAAIWLLTDKKYFNEIAEIYGVTEE